MHDSVFPPAARRDAIAARLAAGQPVTASVLASEYRVSEDSIRRDLRALAAIGLCNRVYGGALPVSPASAPIWERRREDDARKRALAATAARLVAPGQSLFIDLGSTTETLAAMLGPLSGCRVVTNSLAVAETLQAHEGIALYLIGGRMSARSGGCHDARAQAELRRYRFDLCFLGVCALSAEEGLSAFDPDDADMKATALGQSAGAVLMVMNEKLGTSAPFPVCPAVEAGRVVTEHDAPETPARALRAAGVPLLAAAPPKG